ncbi:serine protease Do [Bradyrhizobium japonicum]|jgi:serine protease Do|uniref:S1C family serine protease n=1 Tax=Bradyrhizobium TaxID=374 RepID=UPI000373E05A|nr:MULTISPECIES: trypsin-like peptidase domain-containing protein [Bradyrhizobium]MCP1730782.1 serine protease Do [Bradyrhizobium elkanii]MCP1931339.1 serine protease Do [Bradyrhizobium elkanii]MCS3480536.1 serine protease Do [Bradyrhizobium elkanii]MCS3517342.1 serine protease Do [Bradyrhizobium elkanii]MCS3574911.1 serine protease Do [Bradyrhizobium elkanii]
MNHRDPAFGSLRTSLVTSAFTSALLVSASLVSASLVSASLAHAQPAASRADHGNGGPGEFADLAEKVGPAVIGVNAKVAAADDDDSSPGQSPGDSSGPDDLPDQDTPGRAVPNPGRRGPGNLPKLGEMTSIGSGFFISADGYAVTNNHVLGGSDRADVRTSDNKVYKAKVLGKDPVSDLALLKVDGRTDFSYVKLADQPPRTGDWVLAAGNSFGLGNTVTAGIVSARARDLETGSSEDFVQIDARINRGDSGGPSFNTHGEVIGVNSLIFSPSGGSVGVAFAIPADTVKTVIPQLKDKGTVTRGWMGAQIQSITPGIAESLGADNLHGAVVVGVQTGGPAAKAGLKRGDVITSVNDEPIKSANELTKKVYAGAPGSSVKLSMLRDHAPNSLSVTLGQLAQSQAPAGAPK